MKISSPDRQVVASEMNSRKRSQSSSQLASSQKAKKTHLNMFFFHLRVVSEFV